MRPNKFGPTGSRRFGSNSGLGVKGDMDGVDEVDDVDDVDEMVFP